MLKNSRDKPLVIAFAAIALALLLNAALFSWTAPQPIGQPQQQTTTNAEEKAKEQSPWSSPDIYVAVFTGVLALFAFFTFRDSRRSSERQLRAYVDIESAAYDRNPADSNSRWEIDVKLRNSGQTPAENVIVKIETVVGSARDESKIFEFTDAVKTYPPSRIAPHGQLVVSIPPGIAPGVAGYRAAAQAQSRAYIWGQITYLDAFDERWSLRFQMVCKFRDQLSFGYCGAGNRVERG